MTTALLTPLVVGVVTLIAARMISGVLGRSLPLVGLAVGSVVGSAGLAAAASLASFDLAVVVLPVAFAGLVLGYLASYRATVRRPFVPFGLFLACLFGVAASGLRGEWMGLGLCALGASYCHTQIERE